MIKYILNEPSITDLEKEYVLDVLKSKWLSANGEHTKIFEKKFAAFVGQKHCVAIQSGTAGLHLALKALGVRAGDNVILPNFSCGASISSVVQCGARPIVLDVDPDTFGLDATNLEIAFKKYSPKALQLVHVYGYPARDTLIIKDLCKKYGVFLIEDASEALGATLEGKRIGCFGDVAVFSLRSEKMIGIGEGGAITTDNSGLYDKILLMASRSAPFRSRNSPYWAKYFYDGEGYNYLLPHLLGAVARAQIERFEKEILPEKQRVGKLYRELFVESDQIALQKIIPQASAAYWLNVLLFKKLESDKVQKLSEHLMQQGVEIRSGFWPLSAMSAFEPEVFGSQEVGYYLYNQALVLPSAYNLKKEDVLAIKKIIVTFLDGKI